MSVTFSDDAAKKLAETARTVRRRPTNVGRPQRALTGGPSRMLVRAKLTATLNAGGSASAKVWFHNGENEAASDETITVFDWMLRTGDAIPSGEKVVAALDLASGRYYVIHGTSVSIYRGTTVGQINKGDFGTVTRIGSGEFDSVFNDIAPVGTNKVVGYYKLGDSYFIAYAERVSGPVMTDISMVSSHIQSTKQVIWADAVDSTFTNLEIETSNTCPS